MIKNKNQFIQALKNNKIKCIIREYQTEQASQKIKIGDVATIKKIQSNALQVHYINANCDPWIYFNNYDVIDNKLIYYGIIPEEKKEYFKNYNIIPLTEKEKIKYNSGNNYNYKYKYVMIINKIMEV